MHTNIWGAPQDTGNEVKSILDKLAYPPAVVQVAAASGVRTREGLLEALKKEVRIIKQQLSVASKGLGSIRTMAGRELIVPLRSIQKFTQKRPRVFSHRRSSSLDDMLSMLEASGDSDVSNTGAPGLGCTSLRQRFLQDASSSLDLSQIDPEERKCDLEDINGSEDLVKAKHLRPNSRNLPRPRLVRPASMA